MGARKRHVVRQRATAEDAAAVRPTEIRNFTLRRGPGELEDLTERRPQHLRGPAGRLLPQPCRESVRRPSEVMTSGCKEHNLGRRTDLTASGNAGGVLGSPLTPPTAILRRITRRRG